MRVPLDAPGCQTVHCPAGGPSVISIATRLDECPSELMRLRIRSSAANTPAPGAVSQTKYASGGQTVADGNVRGFRGLSSGSAREGSDNIYPLPTGMSAASAACPPVALANHLLARRLAPACAACNSPHKSSVVPAAPTIRAPAAVRPRHRPRPTPKPEPKTAAMGAGATRVRACHRRHRTLPSTHVRLDT